MAEKKTVIWIIEKGAKSFDKINTYESGILIMLAKGSRQIQFGCQKNVCNLKIDHNLSAVIQLVALFFLKLKIN